MVCTNPVLLSVGGVGDEMRDFGAEVLPDGSAHVMDQIH